jgi:hypothetical protein
MDEIFGEGEERLSSQANAWLFTFIMMWLAGKTLKEAGKTVEVAGKMNAPLIIVKNYRKKYFLIGFIVHMEK